MRKVSRLKGQGYLISSLSVVLLAIPGLKSASESPLLLACLLAGMASSIAGMGWRWRSHRLEQSAKRRAPQANFPAARPNSGALTESGGSPC